MAQVTTCLEWLWPLGKIEIMVLPLWSWSTCIYLGNYLVRELLEKLSGNKREELRGVKRVDPS